MGKDKRAWRKLVKKLRRSRIRQSQAGERKKRNATASELPVDPVELSESDLLDEQLRHDLEEKAWLERERLADEKFQAKRLKERQIAQAEAAEREKIRAEWESKQEIEAKLNAAAEQVAKARLQQQEADFNQLLEFLSGDIDTPPLPYVMPEISEGNEDICVYFSRTGACRFHEGNCKNHIALEQNPDDVDASLEYDEMELRKEFLSFYDDVLPEFQKSGSVKQFKVCCNFEPHLRGNVYVQYENIQESVDSYRKFNGRFYNGKQLNLRFVKLDSWRTAICGQFVRGVCLRGKSCNYLHVFKDPTREFMAANHDWENPQRFRTPRQNNDRQPNWKSASRSSCEPRQGGRSRKHSRTIRSRSRSCNRRSRRKSSRDRSRSRSKSRSILVLKTRESESRLRVRYSKRKSRTRTISSSPKTSKSKKSKHKKHKKKKKSDTLRNPKVKAITLSGNLE